MKFDDASWHYGGNFPRDLQDKAGGIHIAMFVTWCLLNGLGSDLHQDTLAQLRSRKVTPTEWFMVECDGKFTQEDLSEEGVAFSTAYYASEEEGLIMSDFSYLNDYSALFPAARTLYHVPDSWETFDKLASRLSERFRAWQAER